MSESLPTQLKIHRAISEIPEAAWDALVDGDAAPFLEWRWLEALEWSGSVAEASGWEPRHLALWRGNRLVAAAPAYVKSDSSGEFVFDFSWATASERAGVPYYPKLVVAAHLNPSTGRRFLVAPGEDRAARVRELATGALELAREEGLSSVHVLFPTEAEALALEPLGFAVRQGVQYHFLNEGYGAPEDVLQR
ncbi:MAG TPA: peptidogalycan biosysnthesis protein, partial [Myxococcaceae bacterium]|nr:peptidogalycan biosysnthesis protein [Myxococcaceae bacterium]